MSHAKKYALVTGAASGLGKSFAAQLAAKGWDIALCDIDLGQCEKTLELVKNNGGSGEIFQLDVRKIENWQSVLRALKIKWPQIDLLVNNAGVCASGFMSDMDSETIRWVLETNLFGVFNGCSTFIPWLKENNNRAHIINVSSFAAFAHVPTLGVYSASKSAVNALSNTLRTELHDANVRVTVVCPTSFPTNIIDNTRFQNDAMRKLADRMMNHSSLSADSIAKDALAKMEAGGGYVLRPRRLTFFVRLTQWLLPSVFHKALVRSARKTERACLKVKTNPGSDAGTTTNPS